MSTRKRQPRGPRIANHTIRIKWGACDGDYPDLCVSWGDRWAKGRAKQLLYDINKLARDAAVHGWDITTLKFEIKRTPEWIAAHPEATDDALTASDQ